MSPLQDSQIRPPRFTFANLHEVPLDPLHQGILACAQAECGGPAAVRLRVLAETRDLLALAQISGRLDVSWVNCAAGLRAKVHLEAPVPCMPEGSDVLQILPGCVLGIMWPEEAIFRPQAGYAFVRILHPRGVWLSNVASEGHVRDCQPLCLGPSLPAGTPVKEILALTYAALTLGIKQFSLFDFAGVLNPRAAVWWQEHADRIPLTREPFLKGT